MALDQNATPTLPQTSTPPGSVIENEIPTYRAISPLAVIALIFGLLSGFSAASLNFVVFAVLAVVAGALADRKIQRMPDVLTGQRLAHAGIALGIIFGLGSVTWSVIDAQLTVRSASKFSRFIVKVLKTQQVEDAFFYKQPPAVRNGMTAQQMMEQMSKGGRESQGLEMAIQPYRAIKMRLDAASGEDIRFEKIEFHGIDGSDLHAGALLELHGPGSKQFPEKQQYALLLLKGHSKGGKTDWWIEELKFPYTPSTASAPLAPVDDGHGHAH